jgi:hypothetical protein
MAVKILIAVKSCHDDLKKGCHQTIRETWGRDVPLFADLKFFVGGGNIEYHPGDLADEINLRCQDDYDSLPSKTKEICQWSLGHGYEFTFLCDVDTFLIPEKLFKTGFEKFDYSGRFGSSPKIGSQFKFKDGRGIRHEHCHPWASGGFGYFLSRKAARIIANIEPTLWAEDMYIGNTLGPDIQSGNITAADLPNFENEASWHYPAHKLGWSRAAMQVWMREKYQEYKNAQI